MAELGWPLLLEDSTRRRWYQDQLTFSGGLITDVTRAAGVEGDGLPIGSGVSIYEAATNIVSNGGVETNETGYSDGGNFTSDRSTEQAKFGSASFKCVADGDSASESNALSFAITLTAVTHTFNPWVYVPSSWTGGDIRVRFSSFTSMVGGTAVVPNMSVRDQWQEVVVTGTPDAGDLGGSLQFASASCKAGEFFYVDGVMCAAKSIPMPYTHTDGATASRSAGRIRVII